MALSRSLAVVSALVLAIVIGVVGRNLRILPAATRPGTQWATKRLLRAGVVLLGLQLSLPDVFSLHVGELITILVTVVLTFLVTWWVGVKVGVGRTLSLLIATGFAICGASAVAAMTAVSEEETAEEDVATAIAMVTLFGSIAIVVLPLAQGLVGLDDHQMGVWIGSSVHEVAQVVAAASVVSAAALSVAVVVKLGRVVLLAPLVALVGALERARTARGAPSGKAKSVPRVAEVPESVAAPGQPATLPARPKRRAPLVPLFVVGFVGMVMLRSTSLLPSSILDLAQITTTALLTAAMFGLGTGVHVASLVRSGGRAAALGAASTLIALSVSLTGIHLLT